MRASATPAAAVALLVLDYQPSILSFRDDPAPLITAANSAIRAVRDRGGRIGFVRVAFTSQDYAAFPAHSMMGNRVKAGRPGLDADAPAAGICDDLDPQPDDILVRKTRVGAFSTTDLHARLAKAGVTTLVLTGVHTSGAVLTTVREAHDLDYTVIVVSDACADPDPEVHSFLMDRIFPKQGSVINSAALPAVLG